MSEKNVSLNTILRDRRMLASVVLGLMFGTIGACIVQNVIWKNKKAIVKNSLTGGAVSV